MANLYGQVISDRSSTVASRCGNKTIRSSAQTWDGSVIVIAKQDRNGDITFEIEVEEAGSDAYGKRIFKGTIEELINKLEEDEDDLR